MIFFYFSIKILKYKTSPSKKQKKGNNLNLYFPFATYNTLIFGFYAQEEKAFQNEINLPSCLDNLQNTVFYNQKLLQTLSYFYNTEKIAILLRLFELELMPS